MKPSLYFFRQLHSYTGKKLYVNLLGSVFVSFFEGIAVFLLIPMVNLSGMLNISTSTIPIIGHLDFTQIIPKTFGLPVILLFYILLVGAQALFKRQLAIQNTKIFVRFINHVRLTTYRSILQADWLFFLRRRKSDLINVLTKELDRVMGGTHSFLLLLSSFIFTLIQLGIAFWLSPKITLFVLCCGGALAIFSRRFIKKSHVLGKTTSENYENYMAGMTDHFNGIKDIKSNRLEDSRFNWLCDWCKKIECEQVGYAKLKSTSQFFYKMASIVLIVILVYFTLMLFQGQTGQLLMIMLIFSRLWPKFSGIQSNLEQLSSSEPAFKKLTSIQDEAKRASELRLGIMNDAREKSILIQQGLECRHVNFRYDMDQPVYALKDIHLHIPANRMTAIVGRSGAGRVP